MPDPVAPALPKPVPPRPAGSAAAPKGGAAAPNGPSAPGTADEQEGERFSRLYRALTGILFLILLGAFVVASLTFCVIALANGWFAPERVQALVKSAGSLGMADVFTALYFNVLKHDPKRPNWQERDRVILSNGHICPVWYATLAQAGYFPKRELWTLRQLGSPLQGHPRYHSAPGIENTSGPLGQGISVAAGLAYAIHELQKSHENVFCVTSDGEHDEGQTWEAIMLAGKNKILWAYLRYSKRLEQKSSAYNRYDKIDP